MEAATENTTEGCELSLDRQADDTLLVRLQGNWTIGQKLPSAEEVGRQVESDPAIRQIAFDAGELSGWDSGLLSFLTKIINQCSAKNIAVNQQGLSEGRLLGLRCAACDTVTVPPLGVCRNCSGRDLAVEELEKRGTIRTFTVIRVAAEGLTPPFVVALVETASGSWVMGNLVGIDPEDADTTLIGRSVSIGSQTVLQM